MMDFPEPLKSISASARKVPCVLPLPLSPSCTISPFPKLRGDVIAAVPFFIHVPPA